MKVTIQIFLLTNVEVSVEYKVIDGLGENGI